MNIRNIYDLFIYLFRFVRFAIVKLSFEIEFSGSKWNLCKCNGYYKYTIYYRVFYIVYYMFYMYVCIFLGMRCCLMVLSLLLLHAAARCEFLSFNNTMRLCFVISVD